MKSSSKSAVVWVGIVALLGLTVWFGWKALQDTKPEGDATTSPADGRPPSTVIVRPIEFREVVQTINVTGTLRAARRSDVAARESGAVEELFITEGDLVEKGQVLARLDTRRLAAQMQEATASLSAIKAELTQRKAENERAQVDEQMMRKLWDQRAVAEREYLDSVREGKVAAAREAAADEAIAAATTRYDILELRSTDLEIKAPFNGRVVARHTELGEWLNEGSPVATLISTGEIEAWLQLPERHSELLRQTAPSSVELRLPGRSKTLTAERLSIVPDIGGRSRRFTLIAQIADRDNSLTPGSSVEATVPLGTPSPELIIDSDAVLKSYAGHFVFTPEPTPDGPPTAKKISVDVLFERDGETVISQDGELQQGDMVIVEGNERLFPSTPLDPRPFSETRQLDQPATPR